MRYFITVVLLALSALAHAAPVKAERIRFDLAPAIRAHLDQPSRFAEVLRKRVDSAKAGRWSVKGDLATWEYAVSVPEAISLGFYADDVYLPEGSTVTVTGDYSSAVYTADRFKRGTLITGTFGGDALRIEVQVPVEAKATARFSIQRFHVGYKSFDGRLPAHPLYRKLLAERQAKSTGAAADPKAEDTSNTPCDLNYRCKLEEKPEIKELGQSTLAITFSGVGYCSGNLVMDAAGSFTPYITTAGHCIDYGNSSDIYDPGAFLFMWKQETPCGEELARLDQTNPDTQSTGSIIRVMYQDGLLLEALDPPPIGMNPWWAGWDATDTTNYINPRPASNVSCDPTSPKFLPGYPCYAMSEIPVWGIHHGRGYTKQFVEGGLSRTDTSKQVGLIYTSTRGGFTYTDSSGVSRTGPSFDQWGVDLSPATKVGRVRPGASGSGLWLADSKRLLGILSSGSAEACAAGDSGGGGGYQRFAPMFNGPASSTADTALKAWLDPANTGVLVRDGSFNPTRSAAPVLTLTSSATTTTPNSSVRLTYDRMNAGACRLSGPNLPAYRAGRRGFSTVNVGTAGTKTYTLSCVDDLQAPVTKSVTVTVAAPTPAPVVTLSASPATVTLGGSSTLTWSSTDSTSCTAVGEWSGAKTTSGSQSVTPGSTGVKTYTLTCTGSGGTGSRSATVTVNPVSSGGGSGGGASSGGGGLSFGLLAAMLGACLCRVRRTS